MRNAKIEGAAALRFVPCNLVRAHKTLRVPLGQKTSRTTLVTGGIG